MKKTNFRNIALLLLVIFVIGCDTDTGEPQVSEDNFDRSEMLVHWADNLIIPAFEKYNEDTQLLKDSKNAFLMNLDEASFENFKAAFLTAYKSWQTVSMFSIGPAESANLRNFSNIYPTDVEEIEANISTMTYDLDLPSNFDAQGFPALDYMLFSLGQEDFDILRTASYRSYMSELVDRLDALATQVLEEWKLNFRNEFINSDGSSATASVDRMVNDFLFYYEKFFRAGKIGIPAGVFSGNTMPASVEAPYANLHSKDLFNSAFDAVKNFFAGKKSASDNTGPGIQSYLNYINALGRHENLVQRIVEQWESVDSKVSVLSDSFQDQINMDNSEMLAAYDEIQKAVILLKVEMMQALQIQVDYVDADGD